MLPSNTEGKPILLSVKVAHLAAKSFNLTVKFPIKTSGSGTIARRKNIGNMRFLIISLPKKNNIRPYNTKTKENPETKYILSKAQTIWTRSPAAIMNNPDISPDILT